MYYRLRVREDYDARADESMGWNLFYYRWILFRVCGGCDAHEHYFRQKGPTGRERPGGVTRGVEHSFLCVEEPAQEDIEPCAGYHFLTEPEGVHQESHDEHHLHSHLASLW